MRVGEKGCQRKVSPFSRSRMRHWSGSRSTGRRARAPPRRQAVSMCRRRISVSRAGSLAVVATTWLISAIRVSATACRVLLRRLLGGRVVAFLDQAVGDGVAVQAPHCGDEVLDRAVPAAPVAAQHRGAAYVLAELVDLRRGRFVKASGTPRVDDLVPVGAVGTTAGLGAARETTGMYSANVGAGGRGVAPPSRSAGVIPIRDNSSNAASSSAWPTPVVGWALTRHRLSASGQLR